MENFMSLLSSRTGLQIAVISAICAAISITLRTISEKSDKIPDFIAVYGSLAFAIVCATVWESVRLQKLLLSEETLSVGVLSYSVGTVISVAVRRIFKGERIESALVMLIEGIVSGLVTESPAAEIAELLLLCPENGEAHREENVAEILKKNAKDGVSDAEIESVVRLILISADRLIKKR